MATTTYGTPYVSGTDLVANWPAASLTVADSIDSAGYYIGRGNNTQTGSYTAILTDAGKTITMSNASANTVTIPANASVAYVIGTRLNILNLGAGACTPTAAAGVTINGTITALATNGFASLVKTATNTWSYIPSGGASKILQVVSATYSTVITTTSSSYVTTNLTASITPASASNTVIAMASATMRINTANQEVFYRLFRGTAAGTQIGSELSLGTSGGSLNATGSLIAYDSPSTTSAQAYTACFKVTGGTGFAQENNKPGVIILMEVAA